MQDKIKKYFLLGFPLVLTVAISYYVQIQITSNQEAVTDWLSKFGNYVILVYIILQALTVIIAPLGGFFLVIAMIALFGPGIAMTLAYLVVTPCYLINFYLARKYGRPFVSKVIGHEILQKMDHLIKDSGLPLLVITRVFQSGNFDYISYGWGLTKVPFKQFLIVNFLGGIPGSFIMYLVLSSFDNLTYGVLSFYLVTVVLTAIAIFLTHTLKKHKKI